MAVGDGGVDEVVEQLINTASALGSTTIDLSKKRLTQFPAEVLNLHQLEFLYLEGNAISSLPEELFDCLPNLRWLDLRNNRITDIPPIIGKHRNLRNLLLEGNTIESLPLELGLVKSLSGLNISSNPLEFPPSFIVEKGTQEVLKFLREQYLLQLQERGAVLVEEHPESSSSEELMFASTQDNEITGKTNVSSTRRRRSKTDSKQLPGPINAPVTFHPPPSRSDVMRREYDKQRMELQSSSGQAADTRTRQKKTSSKSESSRSARFQYDANANPTFPDYETRLAEQQEIAILAVMNEKEALILQKRKDKQALDDWRQQTKLLRQQKQRLSVVKGSTTVEVKAPYGTEKSAKEEEKSPHGYAKKLKELLEEKDDKGAARRALGDRELEKRIKVHMEKLKAHRSKTYGSVEEELESAIRNLEMAREYQREVRDRKELEYRLRAFTGDDVSSMSWSTKRRTKNAPK
ncbi:leucine-rich repeat-containing protein 27-like isoform X2 [Stylophora pistillata]|uniref:leucine-rich repeat-containing protein 27-like isoform X2 n=1 Tax=Stylophora pistillata TaxID=50429 RepID=UPI000C04B372|nr:leucine-rich repeat-containing protein 27-like isoform X2 [Stylophora pistillata]